MTNKSWQTSMMLPPEYFGDWIRRQVFEYRNEPMSHVFISIGGSYVPFRMKSCCRTRQSCSGQLQYEINICIVEEYICHSGINLRVNSFLLSALSPVFCKIICGGFEESLTKQIKLDDVKEKHFRLLLEVACGSDEAKAEGLADLFVLGELANRFEMKGVQTLVEDMLLLELTEDSCSEILLCSVESGLERVGEASRSMLIDEFQEISQMDGFLKLSEEILSEVLEDDNLGVLREEDTYKAVMRWMSANVGEQSRCTGETLLVKVRYGLMDVKFLDGIAASAHRILTELIEEALTRKGARGQETVWNGVNRLCDKWMGARKGCAPPIKLAAGAILQAAVLRDPFGVAFDREGRIWVSDEGLDQIIVFNSDGTFFQRLGSKGTAAGLLDCPRAVAVDRQGRIVVADSNNHRIQVLNPDGSVVRCIGGQGTAVGQLQRPCGVAIDRQGRFVVADTDNHRIQVFNADGSVAHHFGSKGAGIGRLNEPMAVAVDRLGRIVVADCMNDRMQVFNPHGSVALCFGSEGLSPGQLDEPSGVAVDREGQIYVSDNGNNRIQVYSPEGNLLQVIGKEGEAVGQLASPCGLAVDRAGRILVAEFGFEGHSGRVQVFRT